MKNAPTARDLAVRSGRHLSIALFAASMATSVAGARQVESLGGVPGADVRAVAASADGAAIVGVSETPSGMMRAVEWRNGGPTTLVDPILPFEHAPLGVSEDGTLIAGYRGTDATGYSFMACVWDRAAGLRIDLGYLPGDTYSYANAISGDGAVVAGTSVGPSGPAEGWRWDAAQGMQSLGSFGGTQTSVSAVSRDGSVVVGGANRGWLSAPGTRAFIWKASTGMLRVPGLADVFSYSDDVADGGRTVVGPTSDPTFLSGAFYYREGTGTQEMDLGGGHYNSPDMVLSGDGTTVAGSVWFAGTGTRGFVWKTDGSFTLIHPNLRVTPNSISADGRVVSGNIYMGTPAVQRPFRWTEASGMELLPEPSGGTEWSNAAHVTRDGSAIIGSAAAQGAATQAALWRSDGSLGSAYCGATVPNSAGLLGELRLSGANWIVAQDLQLIASGLPAGRLGIFLLGTAPGFVSSIPSSQGTLCLGGLLGRFVGPGQIQQSNAAGEMTLTVDPGALPGPSGLFTAAYGQQLYFQGWYRDANPTPTSNLTSAASVRLF